MENPGAARIFAFDSSPSHLTSDLFSIITVASALDASCLNMPISEIGDAASKNLLAGYPNASLLESKEGESQFGSPWMYFFTIIESPDTFTAYTGLAVAKAGDACLKINYVTDNKDLNVFSELEFTLNSLAGIE
ncbi:MAG: hypothetical protein HYU84_01990 [Chloroflexi bacterium]|nr:hypothetical protein [Chloroflexota bacterium]